MLSLKSCLCNRHDELRSGWRMLLFVMITVAAVTGVSFPIWRHMTEWEFLFQIMALGGVSVATFVMTRFVNRKPFGAVGLSLHPAMPREFAMGCLLGFLMIAGIFVVEYALGYVRLSGKMLSLRESSLLAGKAAATFVVAALIEELLFRGYLFQTLIQAITFLPALILTVLFFAVSHAGNPGATIFPLVNVALAGAWLSFAYMKTRSLWLPIGLHLSWNFAQTTLFSFPISGFRFDEKSLFSLTQTGPEWITGGSFGPEGGILATMALLLCTTHILKSSMYRTPEGTITLDSVEDLIPPGNGPGAARP